MTEEQIKQEDAEDAPYRKKIVKESGEAMKPYYAGYTPIVKDGFIVGYVKEMEEEC